MPSNESAQTVSPPDLPNVPAEGISYFTPAQNPTTGTADDPQADGSHPPKLFQPLTLRGTTFHNRIGLAPLCQYSAQDGHLTDWHMAHLGGIAMRGPGFMLVEATAVLPEGRISPEDSGLWKDSQIEPLRRIVEFAHSQGQKIGVQLAHAGRKASAVAPFISSDAVATEKVNGWPNNVKGPTTTPFSPNLATPKEMTLQDIEEVKTAWVAAVQRALKAGVDFIEVHSAHGYLLSSFLSPATNTRTDQYGGVNSFENRIRLPLEIAALTRANVPDTMPVFLRVSATDWLEDVHPDSPSWTINDTIRFALALAEAGSIDFLDISSGGNHRDQKVRFLSNGDPAYQAPFAKAVKAAVGDRIAVGAVGNITEGKQANALLEGDDGVDAVLVGRMFQKNPAVVWQFADDLGINARSAKQIRWGFVGRTQMIAKKDQKI
ncbi:hypothetical protein FQN54_001617 [Arachnomyces sp. PD_36]|nr:hypothetical protein FQN54_001617 [Arachnomyces sp. PD_36]